MKKRIGVVSIATLTIACAFGRLTWAAPQSASAAREHPPAEHTQASSAGVQQGQSARPQPVVGTVTTVGVDQFQIKTRDGKTLTVKVSSRTRYRDGQQPIELEDVKPGDSVLVMGRSNGQDGLTAFMVRKGAALQMAASQNGDRTFGRIVSIEGNEVKVENPFQGQEIVVEVTGQTTFSNNGQTITLKDLKVGDGVMAIGQRQAGKFVAQRIFTGNMRGRGGRGPGSP